MSFSKVDRQTGDLKTIAGTPSDAIQVAYNNATSGLAAGNVQSALDEISGNARTFYGTASDWSDLTTAQKKQYAYACLGDSSGNASYKKKYIFISDSYGQHPTTSTSWDAAVVSLLHLAVGDYYRWTEGSMGFMHRGSLGHTTKELCQANAGSVADPNSITDIVILEGLNDAYYATVDPYTMDQLYAAIGECFAYLKSVYVNAKIWIGTAGNMINMPSDTVYENLLVLPRFYSQTAIAYGGGYITGVENTLHWYGYFDDAQHPNEEGSYAIARYVIAALTGTTYKQLCLRPITISGSNGNTLDWNGQLSMVDDKVTVQLDSTQLVFGMAPTPSFVNVELGTYNARHLGHPFMRYLRIPTTLVFNGVVIPAEVRFVPPETHSTSGQDAIGKVLLDVRSYSGPALTSGIINSIYFTVPAELL